MKVTDASAIVNEIYKEMTGSEDIGTIDNSNIIDIGKTLQNIGSTDAIYKAIVDRIGKMLVRNREYSGKFMNILKDGWEFGNILQTLRVKSVEAVADPSYNPQDNTSYDLTTFKKMNVTQKFYTDYDNFQVTYWRPNDQLWSAFNSMEELSRFMTGIEVSIRNGITVRLQGLAKLALTNMIAQTMYKAFPSGDYGSGSTMLAVNLLHLYNAEHSTSTLTAENCRQSEDFLRFCAKTMNNWYDRIQDMSVLFNIDGEDEFTPKEAINMTVLSTFSNDLKYNLYNAPNQFDYSLMSLPNYDTVPYWQGNGQDYAEGHIGEIHQTIKTDDGTETIEATGILAIMYDKEAVAINCEKKKVTAFYHPDLDQTKFFDKYLGQYINAFDRNFVVFYIADAEG